ncbi:Undecaprenyl-phosphate N-acetylglucosaminyl 1-phosphate transferase [Paramagnetospirillum magnetotacticum MS-1]|uniref:Undecaprenyl-phosphate N-acetylglucosaminyl 1-phosphate transferase n=1 Tax=Paramagnetospirillum magnetotacticum MS-1 TaxID=272627 RepID=A0A0C2YDM9_PARME|nr:glycosyltransferase family 4 protein [Paramagnetospirillum magnetotacticum]KIL97819.1 Undecaprenyl-phosphate N-acetylglucosaminyl 1-phosphate transferase [Paramagnetospirillum magnetotacticum MS-1]
MAEAWQAGMVAGLATFAASIASTRLVLAWLRHKQILDHPNERSSHSLPTPRGGGIGLTPVLALALIMVAYAVPGETVLLAAGALILMAISWLDDRKGLAPGPRFAVQAAVIAAALMGLGGTVILPLPLWADRVLVGLAWLWFVNLYNFMDGIDGITGVESAGIGLGLALVAAITGDGALIPPALIVAACGLGFLVWNWHPAKIFMGDSGSIPLGFVLGGLLLSLAAQGQLAAALILPGYYLADATITLLWRLKDGEKIWQAHRRHFYQRAVRGGKSHAHVSSAVAICNLLLIGCACLAAAGLPMAASLMAILVVGGLLTLFTRWAGGIVR